MTTCGRLQRGSFCFLLAVSLTLAAGGCSKVPRQYIWMSERGATLTDLMADPEKYDGKVLLLGGTLIEEEANEQYVWLRLRNRPLDQDYAPQLPLDRNGPEAGCYWVMVEQNKLPQTYREWGRMTVAGRVTGTTRFQTEPVLALLYVRGWGVEGKHAGVWEHVNPNYAPAPPGGISTVPKAPGVAPRQR
ncbi:MAG: Slp family lipoprotein [Nitrospira sp.]|nr:Slp family lipoprotein [Nitrospira sp.]